LLDLRRRRSPNNHFAYIHSNFTVISISGREGRKVARAVERSEEFLTLNSLDALIAGLAEKRVDCPRMGR
jgi:predicted lysophospholipase L1 biosynthesis ABC-type transport system permease subunit